jgi:hypothetical protein
VETAPRPGDGKRCTTALQPNRVTHRTIAGA